MGQAALIHVPGRGGIWPRYLLPGTRAINAAPWMHALAVGDLVGTCRKCGGYLKPGQPYRVDRVDWYPAICKTVGCRWEMAAAGPKPKKKGRTR